MDLDFLYEYFVVDKNGTSFLIEKIYVKIKERHKKNIFY